MESSVVMTSRGLRNWGLAELPHTCERRGSSFSDSVVLVLSGFAEKGRAWVVVCGNDSLIGSGTLLSRVPRYLQQGRPWCTPPASTDYCTVHIGKLADIKRVLREQPGADTCRVRARTANRPILYALSKSAYLIILIPGHRCSVPSLRAVSRSACSRRGRRVSYTSVSYLCPSHFLLDQNVVTVPSCVPSWSCGLRERKSLHRPQIRILMSALSACR